MNARFLQLSNYWYQYLFCDLSVRVPIAFCQFLHELKFFFLISILLNLFCSI